MKKVITTIGLIILVTILSTVFCTNSVKAVDNITIKDIYGTHTIPIYDKGTNKTYTLGGSCLVMNQNVFCTQMSQNFDGKVTLTTDSTWKKVSSDKNAYVLAQDRYNQNTFNNTLSKLKASDFATNGKADSAKNKKIVSTYLWQSVSQNAYWTLLTGQNKISSIESSYISDANRKKLKNAVADLIEKAENYEKYSKAGKKVENTTNSTKVTVNQDEKNNITKIGPFSLKYNTFKEGSVTYGGINSIIVEGEKGKGTINLQKGNDYKFVNSKDEEIKSYPTSGEKFYLKIINSEVSKVNKIKITSKQLSISVKYISFTNQYHQNIIYTKPSRKVTNQEITININKEINHSFDFVLNKKDFNGNNLNNVEFKLIFNNVKEITINNATVKTGKDEILPQKLANGTIVSSPKDMDTNNLTVEGIKTSSGKLKISKIVPTSLTKRVIITIEESKKINGHQMLPAKLYLECNYNNSKWEIKKRTDVTQKLSTDYYTLNSESKEVSVVLKNDSVMNNLLISKNVANAEFNAKIIGVSKVKIHKNFFVNKKPELDDNFKAKATADGNYFIIEIESKNTDKVIRIKNLITKEITSIQNGSEKNYTGILFQNVELAPTKKDLRILLEETKAPEQYSKIGGVIDLTFTKTATGFKLNRSNVAKSVSTEEFDNTKNVFNFKTESKTVNGKKINVLTKVNAGTTYNCVIKLNDIKIPKIQIGGDAGGFKKVGVSLTGKKQALANVEFEVKFTQNGKELTTLKAKSDSKGHVSFNAVQPNTTSDITAVVKEIKTPEGWKGDYSKTIKFKYNASKKTWESADKDVTCTLNSNTTIVGLPEVENKENVIPKIQIGGDAGGFKKIGTSVEGEKQVLSNVEFEAKFTQDGKELATLKAKSDAKGHVSFNAVQPKTINEVTAVLKETKAPEGWKGDYSKTIKFKYNASKKTWESADKDVTCTLNGNTTIVGLPEAVNTENNKINLKIIKLDDLGEKLKGISFEAEFKQDNKTLDKVSAESNDKGEVTFKTIKTKTDNPVEVIIKETKTDELHIKIEKEIKLTLTYDTKNNVWSAKLTSNPDNLVSISKTDKTTVQLEIVNKSNTITLSGQVWLDGQIGEKEVKEPNGKIDANEGLKGVNVYAVGKEKTFGPIQTNDKGEYKFENIPTGTYEIKFEYNGIWYEGIGKKGDSKAEETGRTSFDGRFSTISKGESNDETPLTYTYNEANKTSTLNTDTVGNNGNSEKNFKIIATTGAQNYTQNTTGINCGLVKKEFDLAIGTDVKEAKLKINEIERKYDYAQILDGKMEDLQLDEKLQDISNQGKPTYNLYLNYSDYHYRIDDYKTDYNGMFTDKMNPEDNKNVKDASLSELEAYVTYSVILKNQSTYEAKVEEFVYYYDEVYEAPEIKESDIYTYEIDTDERKITFTSKGNGLTVNSPDYRTTIDITFKVRKDENSNIILKEDCTNITEITKYSTVKGGLIDKDSAPDNGITNGEITQNEDDTDKAAGINISLKNDDRLIKGTVWDDGNFASANGTKESNEALVKDVIVQLIELKKINGKYYEYIWQEARTGSDTVKTTARNGHPGEGYTVDKADGQYQFKDFIAGNYIVRFIYGDGTTVDKTYNGQDYQSTIDPNYNEEYYTDGNGSSVARDNEARRLEVMALTTTINKDTGGYTDNNWMCSETSKMKVEIDSTEYNNVNFGLAKRPETKLVLEKHITGLKITPAGTGVQPIVDAKLDIDKIINNSNVTSSEATGIKNGLSIIKSTRDERGFWKVETDIEELAQGATLEVEYTYVVKDDSEEAYLSKYLVNAYESYEKGEKLDNSYNTYKDLLNGKAKEVKSNTKGNTHDYGKYLGEFYYTNTENKETDSPVLSRVDTIEDNLNNKLKFSEVADSDFKKSNTESVDKNVYDTDGNAGTETIETILQNKTATDFLKKGNIYTAKKVNLTTTLTASSKEISYPSYLEEIVQYSNAAGRRDMEATPGNLGYVHSEDNNKTLKNSNEHDEFWGEKIIVSKPTGENKQAPVQIIVITISSIAVLGVGIILVKKYALKK